MSDPGRSIDVSQLRKKNRVTPVPAEAEEDRTVTLPPRRSRPSQVIVTEDASPPTVQPASEEAASVPPVPPQRPIVMSAATAGVIKKPVTITLPVELKARANQAYRMTSSQEGTRSFAEFVANAIENEIARLEALYNAGARYGEDHSALPIGRPLS